MGQLQGGDDGLDVRDLLLGEKDEGIVVLYLGTWRSKKIVIHLHKKMYQIETFPLQSVTRNSPQRERVL